VMLTFTFSHVDVGNSLLVPDQESSISFTTCTTREPEDGPKLMTLTASSMEGKALHGSIDWRKKTIEVNGVLKSLAQVKIKPPWHEAPTVTEWQWSTMRYAINIPRKSESQIAKCGKKSIASFTPVGVAHAKFEFLSEVPDDEVVFLILVLLYRTLKQPLLESSTRSGVVKVGVEAVDVAVAIATGCCIQ